MSTYENVVFAEKLKLKGKPLNVKASGIKKKKKKHKHHHEHQIGDNELSTGGHKALSTQTEDEFHAHDDYLTPSERRYLLQKEKIYMLRWAKEARKSHRERIQEFNQYLANLSEHYDIPKVGPG